MAISDSGSQIINSNGGIVVDCKAVDGGFFVIDKISNLPDYVKDNAKDGQLCHVKTGDTSHPKGYYKYNENSKTWETADFGGGAEILIEDSGKHASTATTNDVKEDAVAATGVLFWIDSSGNLHINIT